MRKTLFRRNLNKKNNRLSARLRLLLIFGGVVILISLGLPELRLVGAGVDSNFKWAILENLKTGRQDFFEMNSKIFGSAEMVAIEKGKVTIKDGDDEIVLTARNSESLPMVNENIEEVVFTEYQDLPVEEE